MECCRWEHVAFHLTTTVTPWLGLVAACIGLLVLSLNNFGPKPCKPGIVYVPVPCRPCPEYPTYARGAPGMPPAVAPVRARGMLHTVAPLAMKDGSAVLPSGAPEATDGMTGVTGFSTHSQLSRKDKGRALGKPV